MRGDFLEPEEIKASSVVSDGCYPTPAWATRDPVLWLQPEVRRANVSSIGGIGKWMRGPLRAYGAAVNTASHLDVNWTRGPSADLISPCWNHSSSHKGTTNLTHGTRAVKSASYPFFMRKGGLCGLRGVTNTPRNFCWVFWFCCVFVGIHKVCSSLVKKTWYSLRC